MAILVMYDTEEGVKPYLIKEPTEREIEILDKAIDYVNAHESPDDVQDMAIVACLMFSDSDEKVSGYGIDDTYQELVGKYKDCNVKTPLKETVDSVYLIGWY